ncbi:MAG: 50S ribosomal protein L24 [Anaerolineales bacterium]|nr:50S ribosomal protein L24 [Anaerolineales bacterium]
MDIKKGDTVEIISGSDRGKRGVVLRVLPKENRVVVEGVNLAKKHTRQNKQTGSGSSIKGGKVEFPAPIHASNVMVVCPKCDQLTRVVRRAEEERRRRYCRACEAPLDGAGSK